MHILEVLEYVVPKLFDKAADIVEKSKSHSHGNITKALHLL